MKKNKTVRLHPLLLLRRLLRRLCYLATGLVGLVDLLDDTDGDRLPHVTHGETTKWCVIGEGLNTHGLGRDHLDHAGVATFDGLGVLLARLTCSAIDLGLDGLELASDVGGVAIKDRRVTVADLTGVVEDDDLSLERSSLLGGVVLGIRADVTSTNILDRDVLDIEADVVAWPALNELLVVHLDGLDFSCHVRGREGDDHASLDDTGFNTADGHCADTTNLVHILKGKTKRPVGRTRWGFDGVDSLEEGPALDFPTLGLFLPALVPGHVFGVLQHVVAVPARNRNESDLLWVVTNLLDEVGGLLDNFVETRFSPFAGIHFVDGDDKLAHAEGEGKEGMLASLTVL